MGVGPRETDSLDQVGTFLRLSDERFFTVAFPPVFLVGLFVVALGFAFDVVSFSTIAVKSSGSTGS